METSKNHLQFKWEQISTVKKFSFHKPESPNSYLKGLYMNVKQKTNRQTHVYSGANISPLFMIYYNKNLKSKKSNVFGTV